MTGILNLLLGAGGVIKDTYFNLVSLLLPGNGTNGAQNNTFLDSSSNNFTITRNGNTTQGTFSPFSQTGWGNYFNGSSALTMPNSTAFKPGSSDFSIELWYFGVATAAQQYIWGDTDSATNNGIIVLRINPTSNVAVDYFTSSTATTSRTTTGTINANAWNHICVSKTGTTLYIGINGVLETFVGPSSMQSPATVNPAIGRLGAYTAGGYLTGYISNFRYVVGSALYTTNPYTVPKNNLTAISGTSLLTCQSNRFLDNSANNFTITAAGSPSVVAFSPFAPTAAYTTAAVGGSGYFDGTGDYLSLSNNVAFQFGTGDFTIEFWHYSNSSGTQTLLYDSRPATTNGLYPTIYKSSGNVLVFYTNSADRITGTTSLLANTWYHVALSRSGTATKLFLNGIQEGSTYTDSNNYTNGTSRPLIGGDGYNTSSVLNGYLSDVRIVKGTAVYTGAFTPPSLRPLTNAGSTSAASYPSTTNVDTTFSSSNTSLLLNYTNAGITDATAKNDLETVGNAQISTTQSKWGGGSMRFPQSGTNDYLYKPYDPLLNQVNGNFTIECWIYPTVTSTRMIFAGLSSAVGDSNWFWEITSGNKLAFVWTNTTPTVFTATSTASISPNTWTYIAVVKNGGTITQYINGSADGTSSPTGTYRNGSYGFGIGRAGDYNGLYFTGYIDDFRMTIGQARTITASPTAPFPVQ